MWREDNSKIELNYNYWNTRDLVKTTKFYQVPLIEVIFECSFCVLCRLAAVSLQVRHQCYFKNKYKQTHLLQSIWSF